MSIFTFSANAVDSLYIFNEDTSSIEVKRLSNHINSNEDEYWPIISADEKKLFFTRKIQQNNYPQEDFFISDYENGEWGEAYPFSSINTNENEGSLSISADGRFMVFTMCGRKDGYGSCDLYFSRKIGNKWTSPLNMGDVINTKAWETQPALSSDGQTLYFVSNREGGKGKMDIWMTKMLGIEKNGFMVWMPPINLNFNTVKNDMSPFIHTDNRSLYFSSDGYSGVGGLDFFVSFLQDDNNFSIPENLGQKFNTTEDEMGISINISGEKAYFSSGKEGIINRDIYLISLPNKLKPTKANYLKGKILNKQTLKPIFAELSLVNLSNKKDIQHYVSDPIFGDFLICYIDKEKYLLEVKADGYMYYALNINGEDSIVKKRHKNILLTPIAKGEKVILDNVYFDFDSYHLKQESFIELNKIVQFLIKNPYLKVLIAGHTDNIGSHEYNNQLSTQRAREVYNYLLNKNIKKNRLFYKGFGKSYPIENQDNEEAREKNRRTEIIITE